MPRIHARCYVDRESLFTDSNCLGVYGVLIWPPAALSSRILLLQNLFLWPHYYTLSFAGLDCLPSQLLRYNNFFTFALAF